MLRLDARMATLLCAIGLAFNCVIIGPGALSLAARGRNDFRHFYLGGKLAFDRDLYDPDRVLDAQQEAFGETNAQLMPVRLPFYYALISGLGALPYRAALICWVAALVVATAGFVWLAPVERRPSLAVACAWSLPLVFSFAIGQDIAFVLLALGAALKAIDRRRDLLAGLALSLVLIKFNLFVLLPLLVAMKRMWRVAVGLCAGVTFLVGVSFMLAAWNWPIAYAALLARPEVSRNTPAMPNLRAMASLFPTPEVVEVALAAAVVAVVALAIHRSTFGPALAATLIGSLLVSRHAYLADCAVLIPSLAVWLPSSAGVAARGIWGTMLFSLPYAFLLMERGYITALWLAFLLTVTLSGRLGTRS